MTSSSTYLFRNLSTGTMCRRILSILFLSFIIDNIIIEASKAKSKSVTTFIDSKWKNTPILFEVSEYLSDESNEVFWNFVDLISEQNLEEVRKKTDKEYHDFLVTKTSSFISAPKMALLKLALSLRMYSPKVEMFLQISYNRKLPENCDTIADVNGIITCDISELQTLIESAGERNKTYLYKVDHHYPGGELNPIAVVLYAEIGSKSFLQFHKLLKKSVQAGQVDYILRHYLKTRKEKKVRLSGYGVELAIKSTEYKAQDDTKVKMDDSVGTDSETEDKQDEVEGFIFSKLRELYPNKKAQLENLKNHLIESTNEMAPLKVWQIQELSLQAAQRIMSTSTDEALRLMRDISQNFPLQAYSLVKTLVKEELKKEISKNQRAFAENLNIAPADPVLFINGLYFDLEVSDIYSIFDVIREEQKTMDGLHSLGVTGVQAAKMLMLDFQLSKQEYAIDIRDTAIQYINDLENDRRYYQWASSISEILRPTYPGILRSIRKNIYHLIFVLDPSLDSSKDLLKLAESFYIHNAPIRIGLLFTVNRNMEVDGFEDAGIALLNAFNFISQDKNQLYAGLSFITDVYAVVEDKPLTASDVIEAFKQKYPREDLELIFGSDSDYDTGRKLAWEFVDRSGLPSSPQVLINGIPLDQTTLNTELFEESVLNEVMKQTSIVQKAVYKNELNDFHNVLDFLMNQPNVMPRLNDRILSGKGEFLDFTGKPILHLNFKKFSKLSSKDMSGTLIAHMKYLTAREDFNFRPITHWIVCNLETEKGRMLLNEALEQVRLSNDVRVGIVYNNPEDLDSKLITKIVHVALSTLEKNPLKAFLGKILAPQNSEAIKSGTSSPIDFAVKGMNKEAFETALNSLSDEFLKIHRLYCDRVLRLTSEKRAVITNGQILGPFDDDESFTINDFNLLEKFSLNLYGEKLRQAFEEINEQGEQDSISDLAMRVTSLLLARTSNKARQEITYISDEYSVVKIPARLPGHPTFDIKAIVDPVSRGAQKMAPLLMILYEVLNAKISVFLNSEDKLSDMPLKSFYRYVIEPQIHFLPNGNISSGPVAKFHNMPVKPLLTQRMVAPDNWLVEVVRSPYDLDNIHLEDVENVVYSEYELEHLLLEGHCFEQTTGNPPRGLQFILGTNSTPAMVDTIVMANLGYFQLKANPGSWFLRLRQGRSSEIYDIASHEGTDSPPNSNDVQVLMSSFKSHIVKIKVNKKFDKLHMDLQGDDDENGGIWNSITSTFVGNTKKGEEEEENILNIFSVASGHLYERFLRIMMLGVLKHTKTPVKFWFLKNYLSPTFKDFLPHMAKEYKFDYELVQYQWPRWLHQQTEKQRTIWGYKILFLDVLFPLDVKKFIFVDADQIVRADLTELRDLDLGGAPYGYTPFCDSRRDMDGYRFWKSGYWATHLQGRKYHISALYVVDLKRFRRVAAGDRLRGQYQGLSQDPNSLSNLDQDLPNNMIHQVNIKSLPQEWLWCETWCDDASKAKAKTIDLCNNPKTKEPKLASAMRIAPEWKVYDAEIKKLMDRISQGKSKGFFSSSISNWFYSGRQKARIEEPREKPAEHVHSEL